jgi:mannitol-1-phosphate 5-dehydrogenase
MDEQNKEILIWGAGKIGRGFIADLFYKAGYHLIFVDVDKELINNLKSKGKYTIINLPGIEEKEEIIIKNYEALHADDDREKIAEKLMECSLMSISVYPASFEQTAKKIAYIIEQRALRSVDSPLDIIVCANIFNPSAKIRELLESFLSETGKQYLYERVGLIDSLVMRMGVEPTLEMKQKDPLVVLTNGYPELTIARGDFKGKPPEFKGIVLTDNIASEEIRKMYTYNMIHAVYSYFGKIKNYEYIIECTKDDEIQNMAVEALNEVSDALHKEYGFTKDDMDGWNKRVLKNMANPILMDRIDRIGADPVRKLKKQDRLVGPALMCMRNGKMPYYLSKAIACAFLFYNPEDQASIEIKQYLENHNIKEAIKKYCQLEKEVELIQMIAEHYGKVLEGHELKEDINRVNVIKKAYELGFKYEKIYKGCAQCTIAAFFELTGNSDNMLFQCASGLSGGIAITGDGSCGGYTGGVIYMGSYIGRRLDRVAIDGDKINQYKSYEMAQKLHDKFIETYGSVTCADIHKCIFGKSYCLRTKEVRDKFELAGAHKDKCTTVIATACSWIAQILMDENYIKP